MEHNLAPLTSLRRIFSASVQGDSHDVLKLGPKDDNPLGWLVSSPPRPPPSQCTAECAIILAIPFRAIFENLLCGHCGEYVRKIPSNVVGWLLCGGRGLATWQGFERNRIYALHVCFMNLHDTHDLGDRHWTSDGGCTSTQVHPSHVIMLQSI